MYKNGPPPPLGLQRPSRSDIQYRLVVVQNPVHARCCGFGEKDRRLVDPPVILQLLAYRPNGEPVTISPAESAFFVVHCDLFCENRKENRSVVYVPSTVAPGLKKQPTSGGEGVLSLRQPKYVRNLTGSLTASALHLNNEKNEPGVYFVFHDLSVRTDGRFTLKFIFIDLAAGEPLTMSTRVQTEVFSDPFTVYTAKKFPGMLESSPLAKAFAAQGVKLTMRRETYTRASDKYYQMKMEHPAQKMSAQSPCSIASIVSPVNHDRDDNKPESSSGSRSSKRPTSIKEFLTPSNDR